MWSWAARGAAGGEGRLLAWPRGEEGGSRGGEEERVAARHRAGKASIRPKDVSAGF